VAVTLLLSTAWRGAAGASDVLLVGFDDDAAVAANGPIPGVNGVPEVTPVQVCGSDTESYLTELLDTPPSQIKVIQHWGDIIPGKEMMASGIVHDVSLGGVDLPFDHPFSGDVNFNVELDAPYQGLAKHLGAAGAQVDPDAAVPEDLHVELELGAFLHDPAQVIHGPATGEPWDVLSGLQDTLNANSFTGLRPDYIPQEGDRIALMGRWVIDCGHNDYHAELHPVTFMAFGHAVGGTTTVHVLTNPYRSTQRYTDQLGGGDANDVNNRARGGASFPSFLQEEVFRLVLQGRDHLQAPVLLEATRPAPVAWKVCTPPGSSGRFLHITSSFVKQRHVSIHTVAARDEQGVFRCVRMGTRAGRHYKAPDPPLRQCDLPWDWLNAQAAAQAGLGAGFDLRPFIKDAIDQAAGGVLPQALIDAAKVHVDNTPTAVCFDPLAGPLPSDRPSTARRRWRHSVKVSDQPYPFYGTVELSLGD
jgi:hypothetical protein